MITPIGPCTIRVPADCVLHLAPLEDGSGYSIEIIKEESGEVVFGGRFGSVDVPDIPPIV